VLCQYSNNQKGYSIEIKNHNFFHPNVKSRELDLKNKSDQQLTAKAVFMAETLSVCGPRPSAVPALYAVKLVESCTLVL